jgi:hypothetical protein
MPHRPKPPSLAWRMARAAAVAAVLGSVSLGCGSDGEGGNAGDSGDASAEDPDEFCAALARLDALELQSDAGPFIDAMRELDDAAPAEVADATDRLVSFLDASLEIGELDGEEREEAIDELARVEDDFDRAVIDLQEYATGACPELSEVLFGTEPG